MRHVTLFLLPLIILCGCQSPTKPVVYSNTNLEIDQPIRQLEEVLESLEAQQDRNYTIANISFLYGVKLHLIFEEYLASLPENDRPTAILEQKKWQVAHRKRVQNAADEYAGGTLSCYVAGEAAVESYRERIDDILRRMGGLWLKASRESCYNEPRQN